MLKKMILILWLTFFMTGFSHPTVYNYEEANYNKALINEENLIIKKADKYLLPQNHPIKSKVDEVFSYPNILASYENLLNAGFIPPKIRNKPLFIARHPSVPGYVFKFYLDTTVEIDEFKSLSERIDGAWLVQKVIDKQGFQNVCKVPKKWLYEIKNANAKEYVLIAEEMKFTKATNRQLFTTNQITHQHLDGIFAIVTKVGLGDSLHVKNIPYTDDGFIAFIDTEKHGNQRQVWGKVQRFAELLSPENAIYWEHLCKTHRPPRKQTVSFTAR